jgi:hypothetical protein
LTSFPIIGSRGLPNVAEVPKAELMKTILKSTCLIAVVLISAIALAQSPSTGAQLSGTVTDPNGAVIRDATVTLFGTANGFEQSTKTNTAGEYRFLLVPAGQYTLTVEAAGFGKLVNTGVILTVGQAANLPLALQLATAKQEVTVSAEAELVEAQRSSMATTVEQQRIDNLPINGRNYINFTLTNSQVARDTAPSIGAAPTSGLNMGGQRARSNLVNVDGEDAVDNSTNGIRSTVSQDAVQEFQIITNGYAAEYGRASGGVVNIITRSGSNNLHGTAFGFLRNRNIQAVNPFSTVSSPAYTRVQTGATLSGPIKKDKTFFFFSFETTRRHETGFSSIGANNFGFVPLTIPAIPGVFPGGTFQVTPAQAAFIGANAGLLTNPAAGPLLQGYLFLAASSSAVALNRTQPAAFGGRPGFPTTCTPTTPQCFPLPASYVGLNSVTGNFPLFEGTTLYSLRLDHRFSNNQQLMLRGNASPSSVTGIQVNAQGPTENFGQNAFSRTSQQTYRDAGITAQDTWTISNNKVNEFRFQYERRGLLYNFSSGPGGSDVAVNIPGFAFIGREPFSFVRRTEQRYQFTDNFSWSLAKHSIKFGVDVNHLPLEADFTVNFGGVYNFGELPAAALNSAFATPLAGRAFPSFTPVQAYGLGVPQVFIQGIGNPHDAFANNTVGAFIQDSWRLLPNLTLNYGVRYDVEFTPVFPAINDISQKAQDVLGITQGIPRDTNNVAPRVGLAWDPRRDGKTVVRASYGIFYDHPLLALAFDSDVADGTQAPQFAFTGGSPAPCTGTGIQNLNATNIFQGLLGCLPPSFGYLANEQRFNASLPNSIFVNQNYLTSGVPLNILPFGFPTAKNFQYAYSEQAGLGVERDLGHDFALSVAYTFNGGRHLNRPIDANAPVFSALVGNWKAAMADPAVSAATKAGFASNPLLVSVFGVGPLGPYVPAAVTNFFRRSGANPALCGAATNGVTCPALPASAGALVAAVETKYGLGLGVPVPFGGMTPNASTGSSVYHGLTTNLRKRFSHHYEMLASYTWSHAIDDSTDLQSPLSPQDNFRPGLERSNSLFDQRHRFVLSGVYQSGRVGSGFRGRLFSDWTLAPIIEVSSGRPFAILTGSDTNFDFGSNTDRPNVVASGTPPTSCGDVAVASRFSPTGFLQAACFIDGANGGNLKRNAGIRPNTYFTDLRVARRLSFTERVKLDAIMDVFNVINKFNIADVNPLYTQAGTPTAAFDPRQFQFALKLSW